MIDWKNVAIKPVPIEGDNITRYINALDQQGSVAAFCFQIEQPRPFPSVNPEAGSAPDYYNIPGLFENPVFIEHTAELQVELPLTGIDRWAMMDGFFLDGLLTKIMLTGIWSYNGTAEEGKILATMAAADIIGFKNPGNASFYFCDSPAPGKWFCNDVFFDYFIIVFDQQMRIWVICHTATD